MNITFTCGKCGHEATSTAALEEHLEQADHLKDIDYPLYAARIRMEDARDAVTAAKKRLAAAIVEYSRLKTDWRLTKRDAAS